MVVPPGYGIGDIIAVSTLVWTVYKACKGAPGEFQELSRELSTLHTILRELEDEAGAPTSLLNRRGTGRKADLDNILQNLSVVVEQIEDIAKRYHSLSRDQKRAWDRVRFADEDLAGLRSKLSLHINAINLFISSLSAGSLARIEGILDELVRDIGEGKKEPSIISTHEVTEEAAWNELERELIGDGITKQDVERHKDDIKQYLKTLVLDKLLGFDANSSGSLAETLDDFRLKSGDSLRSSMEESESSSVYQREDPEPLDGSARASTPTARVNASSSDGVLAFEKLERDQAIRDPIFLRKDLGPKSEASPALKWVNKFDKDRIREAWNRATDAPWTRATEARAREIQRARSRRLREERGRLDT